MPLPTKTDAVFVRPTSIPTPEGKTERRELRTTNSKTFLHAEKAADGKEIRTCRATLGAVCYVSDDGSLRSIDTTIRDLGEGLIGVEWAPYYFHLHSTGIGFNFYSREGGAVQVTLSGIGGDKFDQDTPLKPDIVDNTITFRDVRPGCDIVFRCLNERVKTLRILRDENAPRTFDWTISHDTAGKNKIDEAIFGTDATGNQLELTSELSGPGFGTYLITETWTGETQDKTPVVYPVEIDPTVTVNPGVGADDGYEALAAFTNNTTFLFFGSVSGTSCHWGIRFPNVTLPIGATVSVATVGFNIASAAGTGSTGTIYGRAADNPSAFDGSNLPSGVSRTTASTSVPSYSTVGAKTYDVTGIAAELGARGGWASGNAMALMGLESSVPGSNYVTYDSYEAGSNIPYLEITYTAGGTAANLLLLGCG